MEMNQDIIFYAFRYALGRSTYAVSDVANYLIKNWVYIDRHTQQLIHKEIIEAVENGSAGMEMDEIQWKSILELLINPKP